MTTKKENPIFIGGADRSGTSLMFALLASHPNISMVRRTNVWRYFYGRFGDLSQEENFEACLTMMLRYKRMGHLNPDADRIRADYWLGEPGYGPLFALFHRHFAEQRGKPRWGDKSLHTEHYAEAIFREYPEARLIHMIRDPRDRFASILKRYSGKRPAIGFPTSRWLRSARVARPNEKQYPGRYLAVTYEALASRPEEIMRQVCDFLDESFVAQMMAMQGAPDHAKGNSSFGQIKPGTISTKSIGRYRQVLTPGDIAFIQTYSSKLMTEFDYELAADDQIEDKGSRYWLVDLPSNTARMVAGTLTGTMKPRWREPIPANRLSHGD
jgi:hypothetical protein